MFIATVTDKNLQNLLGLRPLKSRKQFTSVLKFLLPKLKFKYSYEQLFSVIWYKTFGIFRRFLVR